MEGSTEQGTVRSWLRCYRCWSTNLEVQVHYEGIHKLDPETGERAEVVDEMQEAVVQCLECMHDQPHLGFHNGRVEPIEDRWERMIAGTPWVASCTVTVDAEDVESCSGPEAGDALSFAAFGDNGTREFFTHVRFHKHEDDDIVVHLLVELYSRSAEEATEVLEAAARGALAITSLAEESRPPAASADDPHSPHRPARIVPTMGLAARAPVGGGESAAGEVASSTAAEPTTGRLAPPLALLVAAVGAATLIAEIAAARLLAPFFGASTFIWANTIAVVLLALSAGYALGGCLADRRPRERDLRAAVLGAAVLLAAVPFAGQPLLRAAAAAFDEIQAGAFIASLVAVLVLAAVPLALLGTVGPWAVRLSTPSVNAAGRTAGRLYALSTVGGLAGTFLAALVLVPALGTQRTFVVAAAGLALAAAASGVPRVALIVPAALAALLAVPAGVTRTPPDGARVLLERETPYQYVRVEQAGDERRLILNEGRAIHSVWRPGTVLTGDYWDGYLVIPLAARSAAPRTMAMLGNAGGTVARAYGRYFPATRFDGVEIDPQLTSIGRRWFGMAGRNLHTYAQDARPFLEETPRRYDVIGVDAYRQPYIPFYLATRGFFALARDRLTPSGMVVVNVGHPAGDDGLEKALTATARAARLAVVRFGVQDTNTLLVASRRPLDPNAMARRAALLPPALRPLARSTARLARPALRGGAVWTDDRAPVEWLVDTSIVRYAAKDGAR